MQDKYNIVVLTVNIEFMWFGTKRMEKLASSPHKFYIYGQYTNIVYLFPYLD
jgi:hypothetical protein